MAFKIICSNRLYTFGKKGFVNMFLMIWNDKLNIGIREFDEHHKSLFMILKRMRDHVKSSGSQEQILLFIEELLECSSIIFKLEEEFMTVNNFHNMDPHCKEHKTYLSRICDLKNNILSKEDISMLQELDYLIHWYIFHILESDKEYSVFRTEFLV